MCFSSVARIKGDRYKKKLLIQAQANSKIQQRKFLSVRFFCCSKFSFARSTQIVSEKINCDGVLNALASLPFSNGMLFSSFVHLVAVRKSIKWQIICTRASYSSIANEVINQFVVHCKAKGTALYLKCVQQTMIRMTLRILNLLEFSISCCFFFLPPPIK